MSKIIQSFLLKQKKSFRDLIKVKPEEKIGKFNLLLFGSAILIMVFSIGQIANQKIIRDNQKNNLVEFQITTNLFVNKESLTENANGAPLEPFKTLSQAIEFSKKNPAIKNIYIYPAHYQGILEIPQGINLYAHHPDTFITNLSLDEKTLTLKGHNTIRGLTIQGGRYAIYIPSEAQLIQIKNCKIENASWYGIYNQKHPEINDQYKLELINSEVSKNYRQGLYLQKGTFIMKNSRAINNGEEGVDLHTDMNSTILDSQISNNGEGGVETELGNINLTIQNCLIENNGSSGVNLQSDIENSIVKIENNILNNNRDFGIRCALHSKISKPYFTKALQPYPAKTNQFSGNNTNIDPNCWRY